MLEPVRKMIGEMIGLPTRIVESDRLPSYSLRTMDIEVEIPNFRWMEVCSISKRTDLPFKATFTNPKNGNVVQKDCLVLEIAIGLDRVNYCFNEKSKLL